MQLPGDEHAGWDRLIAAVLDVDTEEATPADRGDTTEDPDTPADTTHGDGPTAPPGRAHDLVRMLDLTSLQTRAVVASGDGDR